MNREEAVFAGAIDCRSPDDLSAYLNEQCAGDQQLRGRVERLLAAHAGADSLLDPPLNVVAATRDVEPAISERPGDQIGHYKLLQEIGAGGFGVVYMAEQVQPVRRRVALKIIKPGMDTREVIARFEAERQALAMMDHPNIAKVLDAGATASGRPYFVMELVKGVPVTQYCDDNSLPTEERLKLFVQVCNAVQHAHQKGVIHRDLKPSNVMVTLHDGVPVPKVIDFGVSKALSQQLTEKTLFTRYGQIIGTPQYMSPEQAELSGLDVDTRSDIYSLGVLLYELLTGRPPFDSETLRKAGVDEMRRMIREDEPPPPSSRIRTLDADTATHVATHRGSRPEKLSRLLRGELDWIVMKALEKNRNRRYETANGLSLDITRHLTNEPVAAGPPSLGYQLWKLYRRHRPAAYMGGSIAASIVLSLGITIFALISVNSERLRADASARDAIAAKVEAQKQKEIADRNARDKSLEAERAKKALAVLQGLLTAAGPSIERDPHYTARQLLDDFSIGLKAQKIDDADVEIAVNKWLGNIYITNGKDHLALTHFQRAADLCRERHGAESLQYAGCLFALAHRRFLAPDWTQQTASKAIDEMKSVLSIQRKCHAEDLTLVNTLTRLGYMHNSTQQLDEANVYLREACKIIESASNQSPRQWHDNPYQYLAQNLQRRGDAAGALAMAERADEFGQKHAIEFSARWTKNQLAESLLSAGEFTKAKDANDLAIDLHRKARDSRLGQCLSTRLKIAHRTNDPNQYRRTVHDVLQTIRESSSFINLTNFNWTILLSGLDSQNAALFDEVAPLSLSDAQIVANLQTAGNAARKSGDPSQAEFLYSRAELALPDAKTHVNLVSSRAHCHHDVGDFEGAIPLLQDAVDRASLREPIDEFQLTFTQFQLATALHAVGRSAEAQASFESVERRVRAANDAGKALHGSYGDRWVKISCAVHRGNPDAVELRRVRAEALQFESKWRDFGDPHMDAMIADALGERVSALNFYKTVADVRDYQVEMYLEDCELRPVQILRELGEIPSAVEFLTGLVAKSDKELSPMHPRRAIARQRLAEFLIEQKQEPKWAEELLNEAKANFKQHAIVPAKRFEEIDALIAKAKELQSN